jgi:kumamolisin
VAERKVFHDSVVPLPDEPGLTANGILQHAVKPPDMTERLTLLFSLEPPAEAQAQLEARVAEGKVSTPEELAQYRPSQESVSNLVNWLKAQGYDVEKVTNDGTSVYASAPLSVIESSLGVNMTLVTKEGINYPAAKDAPSLPGDVGSDVNAIIGLQPYRRARKHLRRVPADFARIQPEDTPASRANGYLVSDLLGAYGAAGLNATGVGQTIGILIDTFPDDNDLKAFWQANGLPADTSRITKINVAGGTLPPIEGEESLDAQWSSGIAPDATVRIYASGALSFVALDRALDTIIEDLSNEPSLRQLSISLGLGELYFESATGEINTQHAKFVRLAAAGVNVFVSSGDAGSNPDQTGHSSSGPTQAEYEASDPCVIGVGGTSLRLSADGAVASETGWSGSGGGKSVVFPRPRWQTGSGVPAGTERLVPDVSCTADPATGGMVVINGSEQSIGGTSWAAPVWAGFCARANDARSRAGKQPLGFLNPLLYPLNGSPAFRDVTAGTNGAYNAGPGYDMVTGLGTPNLAALIDALP